MTTLSSWRRQYHCIEFSTISTMTRTLFLICFLCISSRAVAQSDTHFYCPDVLGPEALHSDYMPLTHDPDRLRRLLFAVVGGQPPNPAVNLLSYTASDSMEGAWNKLIRTTSRTNVCDPGSSGTWLTKSDTHEVTSATLITTMNSVPVSTKYSTAGEHYACMVNGRRTIEWCNGNT